MPDQPSLGVGTTVTLLDAVMRGEGIVRRDTDLNRTVARFAIGIDRSVRIGGRDLYVVAEYQHDGFGARESAELVGVLFWVRSRAESFRCWGGTSPRCTGRSNRIH